MADKSKSIKGVADCKNYGDFLAMAIPPRPQNQGLEPAVVAFIAQKWALALKIGGTIAILLSLLLAYLWTPTLLDRLTLESRFKENMARFGGWSSLATNEGQGPQNMTMLKFSGQKEKRFIEVGTAIYGSRLHILSASVSTSPKNGKVVELDYDKNFVAKVSRVLDLDATPRSFSSTATDEEKSQAISVANEMVHALREWSVVD